jgi:GNAT superfamily N-acetyltransferase
MQFAETDDEIAACLPAVAVLRPHLDPDDSAGFVDRVRRQQSGGYHLVFRADADGVHSVAGFRIHELLVSGKTLYIDDLVTAPSSRGRGHGGALLDAIIAFARDSGCAAVTLDSGPQRHDAHRLYLNHGFRISWLHFRQELHAE